MDISKLKPFDLEAAKRGVKVALMLSDGTIASPRSLIGVLSDGRIVTESDENRGRFCGSRPCDLRMLPEKKIYKGALVKDTESGEIFLSSTPNIEFFRRKDVTYQILKEFEIEYEDD